MDNTQSKGFYKLSWMQRIGFGAGDMAQNLVYQTVSIWLLFYYTNVFGLASEVAALMFFIVRFIDVVWDPVVGALVDKGNPRWGKYRSWLLMGGLPLVGLAILCFWNGFSGSLVYAYVTYVGMSLCYTLVNVPYGALNASLTRDTNEITVLTSTRMFMANLGALCVKSLPLIIAYFAPKVDGVAVYNTPEAAPAWFKTMTLFALAALVLLFFCFSQCKERVVMAQKDAAKVKVSDLWMEFLRNKPLRVLAFFFITAFAMMSVGNAADAYFMSYNVGATPLLTTLFMWLGTIPAFIFMPLVPAIKRKIGKKGMFYLFLGVAILGMMMMYTFVSIPATKDNFVLLCIAQFVKSSGIITATGYMWALVPEVIAYGEYTTGKRISGIVNALTGIFFKAGMALGGVVPGLVLALVGFKADAAAQTPLVLQGILWLVCVIPAMLLLLAMWIISKYELSDERMDEINREIEARS
ncbi:MAG: MFS transporter [Bacteroidales bacterium]|jgi:GPH family glycoside/pentoside/hexuronide:cation symporter|nr:MFS transporter [Bacteroidales bacterium]